MKLKTTKHNRKTGTEIVLHRERHNIYHPTVRPNLYYFLECCGHGYLSEEYSTQKEAVSMMSKPDEWCVGCIEGDPVEEGEQ